jgi:hypothetical protein
MDDDDNDAALHQMELEHRQFLEEWQRDYELWLDTLGVWWVALDKDRKWIEEHQQCSA